MHRTSSSFWAEFDRLPLTVRRTAERQYRLLEASPSHPSLHFKKVGDLWVARVDLNHRAAAYWNGEDYVWFWIGRHDEYERIINRQ